MGGSRRYVVVIGLVMSALALQFATGLTPAFATSCTFDPTTHVANASMDFQDPIAEFVHLTRSGDTLMFGPLGLEQACGTVTTVNTMNIDMAGSHQTLVFDLSNGPFAPGFTDEGNGSSEIEFNVTNATNTFGIGVNGSSGDDVITLGNTRSGSPTFETFHVINLNAGVDGATLDNDVGIHGLPSDVEIGLNGGTGGNDQLRADGTHAGLNSSPVGQPVSFGDGPGTDVMVGGNGDDTWTGTKDKDEADSFSGGPGFDKVNMSFRTVGMSITLDGSANDGVDCPGASCEGDNVGTDVEEVDTGSGNDTITAGAGPQVLNPGGGSNTLFGGGEPDTFVVSGIGPDVVHGGSGLDTVTYQDHLVFDQGQQVGVVVSIDGVANDGTGGEHDNIEPDVEVVVGTPADDQFSGSSGPNRFFGLDGNDVLAGQGGDDRLDGGGTIGSVVLAKDGNDTFLGGAGTDTVVEAGHTAGMNLSIDSVPNDVVNGQPSEGTDNIYGDVENVVGGPFADTITGSGASNRLVGGGGNDHLNGLAGNDDLVGGPGNDTFNGGPGTDTCSQGAGTGSATSCEL